MFKDADAPAAFVSLSTASSDSNAEYLSWRCIDSFEKASAKKAFHVGEVKFSEAQKRDLRTLFAEMNEKWSKEIVNAFSDNKEHFTIGAGNYTFFFLLPNTINLVKQKEPFLPVKLELLEVREASALLNNANMDLVLVGDDRAQFNGYLKELAKSGYIVSKCSYYEEVFLAASKELVETSGGAENVMQDAMILFGRLAGHDEYLFSTAPASRKDADARIVSDLYFYAYLLMQHAVGIWHVHSSSLNKDHTVSVLQNEPIAAIYRCTLYPPRFVGLCRFISRKLMGLLSEGVRV